MIEGPCNMFGYFVFIGEDLWRKRAGGGLFLPRMEHSVCSQCSLCSVAALRAMFEAVDCKPLQTCWWDVVQMDSGSITACPRPVLGNCSAAVSTPSWRSLIPHPVPERVGCSLSCVLFAFLWVAAGGEGAVFCSHPFAGRVWSKEKDLTWLLVFFFFFFHLSSLSAVH